MTKAFIFGLAALAAGALPLMSPAIAAVGDGIVSGDRAAVHVSQAEDAQFVFGDRRFCWYLDGWQGPGWYWCGFNHRRGFGWGGGEGWNDRRRAPERRDWRRDERRHEGERPRY